MVDVIGGGEDFGFIDVVDANSFEDLANCNSGLVGCQGTAVDGWHPHLAFDKMPNTGLGHDGDGHGVHDLLDHAGV